MCFNKHLKNQPISKTISNFRRPQSSDGNGKQQPQLRDIINFAQGFLLGSGQKCCRNSLFASALDLVFQCSGFVLSEDLSQQLMTNLENQVIQCWPLTFKENIQSYLFQTHPYFLCVLNKFTTLHCCKNKMRKKSKAEIHQYML